MSCRFFANENSDLTSEIFVKILIKKYKFLKQTQFLLENYKNIFSHYLDRVNLYFFILHRYGQIQISSFFQQIFT